jgi:phosphomannomutase
VRLREVNTAKEKLREIIADPPKQIADENVTAVYDMSNGFEGLAGASGIYLQLDQARVIIRPSGTEPKIKCYLEVSGDNKNRPTVEKRLTNLANAMQGYLA